jgi:hypothetical protein
MKYLFTILSLLNHEVCTEAHKNNILTFIKEGTLTIVSSSNNKSIDSEEGDDNNMSSYQNESKLHVKPTNKNLVSPIKPPKNNEEISNTQIANQNAIGLINSTRISKDLFYNVKFWFESNQLPNNEAIARELKDFIYSLYKRDDVS